MSPAKQNIERIYPLTPMQEGLLFHAITSPDSGVYFQQYSCRIDGPLDVPAFERAWQLVVDRHAALRTLFAWERQTDPLQIVRARVRPEWTHEDWRARAPIDVPAALAAFLEADRARGFALDTAPLVRFALFRLADQAYRFVWSFHHIVLDGWSMRLVLDEVLQAYGALTDGAEPQLPPARPFEDYVSWLRGRDTTGSEAYWKALLAGCTGATTLRIERVRAPGRTATHHTEHEVRIDEAATARLSAFARQHGLTLNTLVRGAWALLLHHYSGADDVVFGATLSGRPAELDGADRMVGLFINTLPVRTRLTPDVPVVEWLHGLQRQQIETSRFEATSLAAIHQWSDVPKGDALFRTILVFENLPAAGMSGGTASPVSISDARYAERSNYPLAVLVVPDRALRLIFVYDGLEYGTTAIERIGAQLMTLLEEISRDAQRRARDVPMLPRAELARVLVEWNDTAAPQPDGPCVHDLIEQVARRRPDAIAVRCEGEAVSYAGLLSKAQAIAAALLECGVAADDRVVVRLDRSIGLVTAILGVLEAGAAYVPVDPQSPDARARLLVADTGARATIGDHDRPDGQHDGEIARIAVDATGSLRGDHAATHATRRRGKVSPADLAYVMYTSGSTGRPKGVAVEHRQLVHSTTARFAFYEEPVAAFLLVSPAFFDSSVAGLFWTLCQGGTLVLPSPGMEQDVHHLADLIARHGVTHTLCLPSLYAVMLAHVDPAQLASLRTVIVAGEACPPSLVAQHFATLPDTALVNEYGPAEATVWCTAWRARPSPPDTAEAGAPSGRVPIGRPIAGTRAYILDADLRPVPIGVPGELCVSGAGLARGYLGQPERTAERFVDCRLPDGVETRVYRTGDIARWLENGEIDLLGRADHQIKIRGQRVEPGEIEAVLREHPAVRDAAVMLRDAAPPVFPVEALVDALCSIDADAAHSVLADVEQSPDHETAGLRAADAGSSG